MSETIIGDLEALLAGLTTSAPLKEPAAPQPAAPQPAAPQPAAPQPTQLSESMKEVMKGVIEAPVKDEPVGESAAPAQPADFSSPSSSGLLNFIDPEQLKIDIDVNPVRLDEAIRAHAGLLVHYSGLAARARMQYDKTKNALEVTLAQLYKLHRDALTGGGSKATEAQVDAAIKMDPRWIEANDKVAEARLIMDLCAGAREGFQQRRDMLVQVSVDRRNERQGELRVGQGTGNAALDEMLKR